MIVELDKNVIANALSLYKLKRQEDVKYWRQAELDAPDKEKEHCRAMQDDARLELLKVNAIYDRLQDTNTTCLADYVFYAERKR